MNTLKHPADEHFVEAFQFRSFYKNNIKDENIISLWKRIPDVVVFTCDDAKTLNLHNSLWIGYALMRLSMMHY
jgi:hypothetical protein